MNKRILALLIAVFMVVIPILVGSNNVKAAEDYIIPVQLSDKNVKVDGLEEPLKKIVEKRQITLSFSDTNSDRVTTHFYIEINNPKKPKRVIYASIIKKISGDCLKESNIVTTNIFKGDSIRISTSTSIQGLDKEAYFIPIEVEGNGLADVNTIVYKTSARTRDDRCPLTTVPNYRITSDSLETIQYSLYSITKDNSKLIDTGSLNSGDTVMLKNYKLNNIEDTLIGVHSIGNRHDPTYRLTITGAEHEDETPFSEDPYTIPITNAEGYEIKGLETPLKNEAEPREIKIVPTADKETTVDNFEVIITNPNRPPRTVYSSIVWLGENKVEGKNDKQILNSTKYNITMYKNDKVELKVKSEPYTLVRTRDENTDTTNPSNPQKSILVKEGYYTGGTFDDRCYGKEFDRLVRDCDDYTEPNVARQCRNRAGEMARETCTIGKTWVPAEYRYESQGTYTKSITTVTEKYTSPELDVRHKPIEISGTNITLKNNAKTKIDYAFNWISREVITGKKDSDGAIIPDVNKTNNRPTTNFTLKMTNAGYSVISTAAEEKEFEVIKMPAGTTAETIAIKPGTTKDLSAYKDSTIAFVSKSEKEAADTDTSALEAKIKQLEAQITQLQQDLATKITENQTLTQEKANLQSRLDEALAKLEKIENELAKAKNSGLVDGQSPSADIKSLIDKINTLQGEVEVYKTEIEKLKADKQQLQDKVKELEIKVTNLEAQLKQCQDGCAADTAQCTKDKAALQKELDDLKNKVNTVVDSIGAEAGQDTSQSLDNLKNKIKELQDKLNNLNPEVKKVQDRIDQIDAQKAEKEVALNTGNKSPEEKAAIQEEINNLTNQKVKLEEALRAILNGDYEKAKKALAAAEALNKELQEKNKKLQDKLDNLNTNLKEAQAKLDNLNKQLADKQAELDELNEKIAANEAAKKDLQDKLAKEKAKPEAEQDKELIAKLEKDIADKDVEGKKLANQKKALEDEIAKLKKAIKALEDSIAALMNGDYEKTKKDLEESKKDLEKSKKKNKDLEKVKKDADNKAKELQKEIEDLSKKLKDAEENSSKISEDLKKVQDKIDELNKQLKDKQKELEDINNKIAQNEKEQKEIQDKINAEKAKPESEQDKDLIAKLEKELEDKKNEHKTLTDKKKALENEIEKLKKEVKSLKDAIKKALNKESQSPDADEIRIIKKLMNGEALTPDEIAKIKELLLGDKLTDDEKATIKSLLDKGKNNSKNTLDSIKDTIFNNSGKLINPFDRTLRSIDDVIKDKTKDLNKIAKELLAKLDPNNNIYTKEMLDVANKLKQAIKDNKVTQELIDKFNSVFKAQKSAKKSNNLASILAKTPKMNTVNQDYVIVFPIGRSYYIDNGERIDIDVSSYASNGRTMLPIRYVANSLGYSVQWHQDTKTVEFTNVSNPVLNQGTFILDINTGVITGPNVSYTMDVKPEIKSERTFVSISNIVKAFGGTHGNTNPNTKYTIEWNKDMYSAILNKFVR